MSTTVDLAFVKQYEREVHEAYQRMGSKLRNTVRNKNNVKGSSTTFQKVGKGAASTKTRHGKVPVMNVDHTPIECAIADYYAGDYVDKLDEGKIEHDERRVIVNAGAFALGRKTDELIINGLNASDNIVAAGATGMTKAKALTALETLGDADVPDDGKRFAIVGWQQWTELIDIPEFANADFVGSDELPWKGTQAKRWLGALWMPHSGLPVTGTTRHCFWYHWTAVGHASGQNVQSKVDWVGERAAHFVSNMMAQGACLIDKVGALRIECDE